MMSVVTLAAEEPYQMKLREVAGYPRSRTFPFRFAPRCPGAALLPSNRGCEGCCPPVVGLHLDKYSSPLSPVTVQRVAHWRKYCAKLWGCFVVNRGRDVAVVARGSVIACTLRCTLVCPGNGRLNTVVRPCVGCTVCPRCSERVCHLCSHCHPGSVGG